MPAADRGPAGAISRPYRVPVPADTEPAALLARLDDQHSGALWGEWFGGGLIVLSAPLTTVEPPTAADGFAALDQLPAPAAGFDGIGGGWLACLGYRPGSSALAFYDSLLRWTAESGWVFESLGLAGRDDHDRAALDRWRRLLSEPAPPPTMIEIGPFRTRRSVATTRDDHLAAIEAAIGRIGRGDFYQVNLCTRLSATTTSSAPTIFAALADRLRPAYGGMICGPDASLASFSPELFLRVEGDRVTTAPIKGTAPRTPGATDSPLLRASTKDAAENVMIVDLMRNDLSRVCLPGTVAVPDLLGVRPHPGVWHLVSTVTGTLRPDVSTADLLTATFPPGSVTGAPKISAERGIAELESESRRAYTGAFGFVSPYAGTEFNVIIRTFELRGGTVELGVGGGITTDSVPIREWYECMHKAAPLVAAAGSTLDPELTDEPEPPPAELTGPGVFESVLAIEGRALRLADHLARLDRSCRELYAAGPPEDLAARVRAELSAQPVLARRAIRVAARPGPNGLIVEVTSRPLGARLIDCALIWATRPCRSWRHKWVDRDGLQAGEQSTHPALPYFSGPDGALAETSRGNLFLLGSDGVWRTPPLDEQVLPGVTRRAVLDLAPKLGLDVRIARVIDPTEVAAAFWTSSLSGAVAVTALDGRPLGVDDTVLAELNRALGFA